MKKIKNKAKYKRHQAKKARKRKTVAKQKARSQGYSNRLRQNREKEMRDFIQFAEFMQSAQEQQTGGAGFVPNFDMTTDEDE